MIMMWEVIFVLCVFLCGLAGPANHSVLNIRKRLAESNMPPTTCHALRRITFSIKQFDYSQQIVQFCSIATSTIHIIEVVEYEVSCI